MCELPASFPVFVIVLPPHLKPLSLNDRAGAHLFGGYFFEFWRCPLQPFPGLSRNRIPWVPRNKVPGVPPPICI